MTEAITVKTRAWGNSLGVIIPKEIVQKENIKANDTIKIQLEKKGTLENFFGKGKHKQFDTEELRKESKQMGRMD